MWMQRYINSSPACYKHEVHWARDPAGRIGGGTVSHQPCIHVHKPKSSRLLHPPVSLIMCMHAWHGVCEGCAANRVCRGSLSSCACRA